ncbi:hypothetical protein HBH70_118430 [Parastagonospora nodorum]|nr:hypothetical protein HBI10_129260 [Parastagonospora nodorum]KAH4380035.1 hypothetical protein HBH97_090920 [Parastagonospora nodorum]KAH4494768.1 hypothetical protein HBH89_152670 [Parastagonospora nodorum]KAH4562547.1 hypothetical protein HBH86_058820 [Parastagonospora nodorum]KAH4583023.1 hypothetical protein HBH84_028740 [Parastagonospora nodorum]
MSFCGGGDAEAKERDRMRAERVKVPGAARRSMSFGRFMKKIEMFAFDPLNFGHGPVGRYGCPAFFWCRFTRRTETCFIPSQMFNFFSCFSRLSWLNILPAACTAES